MGQKEYASIGAVEQTKSAENELGKIVEALSSDPNVFVAGLFFSVGQASTSGRLILSPTTPDYTFKGLNKFRNYLLDGAFKVIKDEEKGEEDDHKSFITERDKSLVLPRIVHVEEIGIEQHITTTLAKINDDFDLELMRAADYHDNGRIFGSAGTYDKSIHRVTHVNIFPEPLVAHLASKLIQLKAVRNLELGKKLSRIRFELIDQSHIRKGLIKQITSRINPFGELLSQLETLEQAQAEPGQAQQTQAA